MSRRNAIAVCGFGLTQTVPGATAAPYLVGHSRVSETATPYSATISAINAGQCPLSRAIGKTVVIKVNLVAPSTYDTGTTTDPNIVKAVVDVVLAAGATRVKIVEAPGLAGNSVPFSQCGYRAVFDGYAPFVQLVDLGLDPLVRVSVPYGLIYRQIYLPSTLTDQNAVIIGFSKLKTHSLCTMTGAVKLFFGCYIAAKYTDNDNNFLVRADPHHLGVDQAITDMLAVLWPKMIFHVMDACVGMQGNGPLPSGVFTPNGGTPIASNFVLAGRNPVAVDRVAASIIGPLTPVSMHLDVASYCGFGPSNSSLVNVAGDAVVKVPYRQAKVMIPPTVWPTALPASFTSGSTTRVYYENNMPNQFPIQGCMEIIQDENVSTSIPVPGIRSVRTLFNWTTIPQGRFSAVWDGRERSGALASPGTYQAWFRTNYTAYGLGNPKWVGSATNWITIA